MQHRFWLVSPHFTAQSRTYLRPFLLLLLSLLGLTLLPAAAQAQADTCNSYPSPHQRMGVNVTLDGGVTLQNYDAARLNAGWYHDYNRQLTPSHPGGMQYHQMIRTGINIATLAQTVGPQVDANPGSIWAVGNEPDRYGQDEQTPAQYAVFYHEVYTFLKQRDPTSRVAAAAIVQATPIRLRYLSMVLAEYQQRYGVPMPVDIWTMHGFILPENCNWGAGLPPGLEAYADEAVRCLATLGEHGNIATFKARVYAFRQWMKENNYRDKPLILSEYGILLSKFHSFSYDKVRDYMLASFDFLLKTTDNEIGLPSDGNRLVQEFSWFSLNFYEYNVSTGQGLNGNLFDHDSRQLMPLGTDYETYAKRIRVDVTDLKVVETTANPAVAAVNQPVTLRSRYVNQGGVAAQDVSVRFWLGDPRSGGQLLGTSTTVAQVLAGCHPIYQGELTWTPPAAGTYPIFTDFQAANLAAESSLPNNYGTVTLTVDNTVATLTPTVTPLPTGTTTVTPIATSTPTPTDLATATATFTPTPTTTPIAGETGTPTATPTPTATVTPSASPTSLPAVSAIIQPNTGGTLRLDAGDHQIVLTIPVGAVEQTTAFVLRVERGPIGNSGTLRFLGLVFTIDAYPNGVLADNFVFSHPATVSVTYQDETLGGANENEVALYYYASSRSEWQTDGIVVKSRNPAQNQLTVEIAHLTQFGLFAGTATAPLEQKLYLPLLMTD